MPWVFTLFARGLALPLVERLWSLLFARVDTAPHLAVAVVVALLVHRRGDILAADAADIPVVLGQVQFRSTQEVADVVERAAELLGSTPMWAHRRLSAVLQCAQLPQDDPRLHAEALPSLCVMALASEIVLSNRKDRGAISFLVFDCRSAAEFCARRLSVGLHLDPALLGRPEDLAAELGRHQALRGCHICFVSADTDYSVSESEQRVAANWWRR
eukprot:TRINITY_DN9874_c0_g1_i6.p3 TRINITY_DN9874_c0_g1~~TRINITY_DN9874_c0_g1_i6.p3  ORF type:complete len:215 (-),score=56.76 TRINITY_DN9874_c0_g1_i6:9-653(-)